MRAPEERHVCPLKGLRGELPQSGEGTGGRERWDQELKACPF